MPPSPAAAPPAGGSQQAFQEAWHRQQRWWHALYGLIWVVTLVVVLLDDPGAWGRWPEVVGVVAMLLAYVTLGVPALRQGGGPTGAAYLLVSWTLMLGLHVVNPGTETWLFFWVFFPHLWAMVSVRWAVIGTVVAMTTYAVARWWGAGFAAEAVAGIAVSSVTSVGLSLALGLFTNRMVREAGDRAVMIDELRSAQEQLASAERDRGVHDERERLAREIHDTLAQGFTSVLALSRAADAALARGDVATARERLALVQATAADNLSEARLIVAETTPGHLQSRTLVEALERLVGAVTAESGLDAWLEVVGTPLVLGAAADVALLRAAQESLANVRRHSGAAHVRLTLTYAEDGPVRLDVTDDGRGFAPADVTRGFGLDGVRARAAELGGSTAVTSVPGRGATVTVEVPR